MFTLDDLQKVVPNVLQRLNALVDLPTSGTVAGQSVASLFFEELGLDIKGPINDVDVFVTGLSVNPNEAQSHKLSTAFSKLRVDFDSYAMINVISSDSNTFISSQSRDGLKNTVVLGFENSVANSPHSLLFSQQLISGFDINMVKVGINLDEQTVVAHHEFLDFLVHKQVRLTSVRNPEFSLVRMAKKKVDTGFAGITLDYDQELLYWGERVALNDGSNNNFYPVHFMTLQRGLGNKNKEVVDAYPHMFPPLRMKPSNTIASFLQSLLHKTLKTSPLYFFEVDTQHPDIVLLAQIIADCTAYDDQKITEVGRLLYTNYYHEFRHFIETQHPKLAQIKHIFSQIQETDETSTYAKLHNLFYDVNIADGYSAALCVKEKEWFLFRLNASALTPDSGATEWMKTFNTLSDVEKMLFVKEGNPNILTTFSMHRDLYWNKAFEHFSYAVFCDMLKNLTSVEDADQFLNTFSQYAENKQFQQDFVKEYYNNQIYLFQHVVPSRVQSVFDAITNLVLTSCSEEHKQMCLQKLCIDGLHCGANVVDYLQGQDDNFVANVIEKALSNMECFSHTDHIEHLLNFLSDSVVNKTFCVFLKQDTKEILHTRVAHWTDQQVQDAVNKRWNLSSVQRQTLEHVKLQRAVAEASASSELVVRKRKM